VLSLVRGVEGEVLVNIGLVHDAMGFTSNSTCLSRPTILSDSQDMSTTVTVSKSALWCICVGRNVCRMDYSVCVA